MCKKKKLQLKELMNGFNRESSVLVNTEHGSEKGYKGYKERTFCTGESLWTRYHKLRSYLSVKR